MAVRGLYPALTVAKQAADLHTSTIDQAAAAAYLAEADLIAAQSLLAMGKASAAKERAKASLRRYPNRLYARQLREILVRHPGVA